MNNKTNERHVLYLQNRETKPQHLNLDKIKSSFLGTKTLQMSSKILTKIGEKPEKNSSSSEEQTEAQSEEKSKLGINIPINFENMKMRSALMKDDGFSVDRRKNILQQKIQPEFETHVGLDKTLPPRTDHHLMSAIRGRLIQHNLNKSIQASGLISTEVQHGLSYPNTSQINSEKTESSRVSYPVDLKINCNQEKESEQNESIYFTNEYIDIQKGHH